ncbi:MAG: hypothetical protein K5643_07675 [Saccharofermentans sp.]|nr:hypothetical protein [Saccharofermentans sp.]
MTLDQTKRLSLSAKIFIVAVIVLLYCPFFSTKLIGDGYVGDTMIQTRIGLDMISGKGLILEDIYSWHEGLNWVPHEEGWYLLTGLAYKLFGLIGIISLTAVLNYAMAAVIFKENLKTSNPYMIMIAAATARLFSFPDFNARPHLVSQLLFVIFVFSMLNEKISGLKKCILFVIFSFIMAWFHGGMLPLFLVVFMVFIVIELIYRNFKTALIYLAGAVSGFAVSLLNPVGIAAWTYAFKQSGGEDYWNINIEWQPKTFSIPEITVLLLLLVAFAVDERVRNFDKKTITKLCFFCMFIIISCKHCRFMSYTAVVIAMFAAEEITILIKWLNGNITRFDLTKLKLGDLSHYIIAAFCAGYAIFMTVTSWMTFFPTNTMSDVSAIAAYDEGVITVLKEKDYKRIYNSFNTGTWLAFYGIPVHIDNRADLYMREYSGVDHLRGKMIISDIDAMNDFVAEYDPDAVVLDLYPGTTDEYFLEDIYASGKYKVIYDNTVSSTYDPDQSYRWVIAECVK